MNTQTIDLAQFPVMTQTGAHGSTSERYQLIPTMRVASVLQDHGWMPVKVQIAGTRAEENAGFQKHLIRFRNPEYPAQGEDGLFPELVLRNSHMGNASFQLMAGLFRLICSNGLTIGETWNDYRVRHVGYTDDAVADAIAAITEQVPRITESVDRFKSVTLSPEEQKAYAKAAIELRFDGDSWAAEPQDVLVTRRIADRESPTLWNTFNVVQENLIRGGMRVTTSQGRRTRARSVKNIDQDTKINKALWTLADEMAKIKAA